MRTGIAIYTFIGSLGAVACPVAVAAVTDAVECVRIHPSDPAAFSDCLRSREKEASDAAKSAALKKPPAPILGKPIELRGLRLGAPTSPEQITQALGVSCGEGYGGTTVCNGRTTLADVSAVLNALIDVHGRFARAHYHFHSDQYEIVRDVLTQTYGKPTITREAVQNRFGAQYINETASWGSSKGAMVHASQYAGSLDRASVYFSTPSDREALTGPSAKDRKL
jgi:hypothetical protein